MRTVLRLNISDKVKEALESRKSTVIVVFLADARVLDVVTIGAESNSIEPGYYVLIDHAVEGPEEALSLRLVPDAVKYRENITVDPRYVGFAYHKNDAAVCAVFHLTGRVDSLATPADECEISWAEQDASNS
jgi:hypothetical protein